MLTIQTYLAESKIPGAGLGLFCKEFVPAGTVIWTFHAGFDYIVDDLPQDEILRNFIVKYGYRPITGEQGWVMCADDARFFNHSDDPTCLDFGAHTTARYDRVPIGGVGDGGRRRFPGQAGMGQAAATGRLTSGSSLNGAMVSSVM